MGTATVAQHKIFEILLWWAIPFGLCFLHSFDNQVPNTQPLDKEDIQKFPQIRARE